MQSARMWLIAVLCCGCGDISNRPGDDQDGGTGDAGGDGAAGRALLARFTRSGAVDTLFGAGGTGTTQLFIGDAGLPGAVEVYSEHLVVISGGNQGGTPGPGTFGIVARVWM